MKRVLVLIVLLACGIVGCGKGAKEAQIPAALKNVELAFGPGRLEKRDLQAAAGVLAEECQKGEFKDCKLQRVAYDEAKSDKALAPFLSDPASILCGTAPENAVMLLADFRTGKHPSVESKLEANKPYTAYPWYLARKNAESPWEVIGKGYD